jgi:hypothetical protein
MKITRETIEKFGFTHKVEGDDNNDITFNKPSQKGENWLDLLVWQPDTNEVTVSQHTKDLFQVFGRGRLPKGKKVEDYIVQVFQSNMKTTEELESSLVLHNII